MHLARALTLVATLALVAGARAQDGAPAGPPVCELHGTPTLREVRVHEAARGMRLVSLEGRSLAVVPLSYGTFRVRTTDEGPLVEGDTREALPLALARDVVIGGAVTVAAGTPVERLEPHGEGVRVDIPLDEGVRLVRVDVPCAALSLGAHAAAAPAGELGRGPRWHARVTTLRLRARADAEAPRATLALTPEARARTVWIERARTDAWIRVEALFAHAAIAGWIADSDLTP